MTSSGGNVQISQSSGTNSQNQASGSSTPISLVNTKSIILNQATSNNRMAIPIVLSNQIDSNTPKKCTQQNKVTLQSLKNLIDKPTASALKNSSSKPVSNALTSPSPKIVLPSANKSSSSGQATTIAQICANLNNSNNNNNHYRIQTNPASQQLISHMIPGPIRFIVNPSLVNSTIASTLNATNSYSATNVNSSNQSPNSSPLKPNIIRKARRDSPSSHTNLGQFQSNSSLDYAYNGPQQSKPAVFELSIDPFKSLPQVPSTLPQSQNGSDTNQAHYLSVPASSLFNTSSSTSASPSSSSTSTQSVPKNIYSVINEVLHENSSTSGKSQTIRKMTESRELSPQPSTSSQPSDSTTGGGGEAACNRKRRKQEFKKQSLESLSNNNPLIGLNEKRSNQSNEMDESEPALKIARVHNQLIKTDKKRTHSIKIKDHDLDEPLLDDETVELLSKEFSYVDREGVKWTSKRQRHQFSIDKYYAPSWKPKQNHFVKYSDVDLALSPTTNSQVNTVTRKQLVDNLNEWRFHCVISQVNDLMDYENESLEVMNEVGEFLKSSNFIGLSDICFKISESIKANSQRHKYVNEQLDESQIMIHKLFEHKEKYKNYLIISSGGGLTSSTSNCGPATTNQQFSSSLSMTKKKKLKKTFRTSQINTRNNVKTETKIKSK
uniref:Histone deacetylase complex subunit SAP130-like protein n=1 Tax=Brachionus koreanus TaxID=1199090 RepID=A0A4Y6EZ25_9BILA|nr:histone deacetylase complex subunit SAP130-like protein [Brachionus koreanus]